MAKHDAKSADRVPSTPEGRALMELMWGLAQAFFKMRAAGKEITAPAAGGATIGAVTPTGAGVYGLLRSLVENGPQTVPALARVRPVARQHIQRMANEMVALGLVEFIANPAHKRSRLLAVTLAGEEFYAGLSTSFEEMAERLAADMDLGDLETTVATLRTLARKFTCKEDG
ncbi:MAG: MarR family transcriptional regulator [Proteobacteria bacterium]|nr:MarR family transcriptional regulator [Pseudomonadota bacterium]MDA1354904.1 MarR family transcriptional regulator [Pseudomonadota bacterium]